MPSAFRDWNRLCTLLWGSDAANQILSLKEIAEKLRLERRLDLPKPTYCLELKLEVASHPRLIISMGVRPG